MFRLFLMLIFNVLPIVLIAQADGSARRFKVMQYNLLQFGLECGPVSTEEKISYLRNVLIYYKPDLFAVNELSPEPAFGNLILEKAFAYSSSIALAPLTNEASSPIVNALFYNQRKFGFKKAKVLKGNLRDINIYTLFDRTSIEKRSDTNFIHIIIAHFKAGNGSANERKREAEAREITRWISDFKEEENIILLGDLNLKSSQESAYQLLINDDSANPLVDPIQFHQSWTGEAHALLHTQSTRDAGIDCGSIGGLDDRFDMILVSRAISEGKLGILLVPDSYHVLGNDGKNYNKGLLCHGDNIPILICSNLKKLSDHLPVVAEFEVSIHPLALNKSGKSPLFRIYPNPGSDVIHIHFMSPRAYRANYQIEILNSEGKLIFRSSISYWMNPYRLITAQLPKGLFLIRIVDSKGNFVIKPWIKTS